MIHHKTLTMLLAGIVILFTSCAKDYADEQSTSDANVAALKQTDIELRKLIQSQLPTLNAQFDASLNSVESEKREVIMAKVKEWTEKMNLMIEEMEQLTDQKISQRTVHLANQTKAIEEKIEAYKQHNNEQIALLEKQIKEAQANGDDATTNKLEALRQRLVDAGKNINDINKKVDTWESKLNDIAKTDHSAVYTELKSRIPQIDNIDLIDHYKKLQAMTQTFVKMEYDKLTTPDLQVIIRLVEKIESVYEGVYPRNDEIMEKLKEWEVRAPNECIELENTYQDLENIDLSPIEDAFDECLERLALIEDMTNWAEEIEDFASEVENAVQEANDKAEECQQLIEEISSYNLSDYDIDYGSIDFEHIGTTLADEINNKLQELSDRHPHAWGGTTPSVSW